MKTFTTGMTALILLLAACGSSGNDNGASEGPTAPTTADDVDGDPTNPDDADGDTDGDAAPEDADEGPAGPDGDPADSDGGPTDPDGDAADPDGDAADPEGDPTTSDDDPVDLVEQPTAPVVSDDDLVTLESLQGQRLTLIDTYGAVANSGGNDLPTVGSAVYEGVGAFSASETTFEGVEANPDTLSSVQFTTNFANGTVSGKAFDFRAVDGGQIDGELVMQSTDINGNRFTTDVGGTLINRGVTIKYDGRATGQFKGEDAPAIAATGTATGVVDGEVVQNITATFTAER